ncbi:MAG TPA: class I SAM-dependent methyltransferase [Kineosporiaceae bacterium]|nr:class I SAM-dependent methyltransferase [Kineosporiaceae bacterium]
MSDPDLRGRFGLGTELPSCAAEGPAALHEQRRLSFGEMAGVYAAVRPEWPAPTAAWLTGTHADDAPASAPLDVLDLGAGTGKLTRSLVEAGHRVVALDPSPGMLSHLVRGTAPAGVCVAAAERLPLADRAVDAVTVAQAWHWFRHREAAAECARVLRPAGVLSVAWHARDERIDWVAELSRLAGRPEDPTAAGRDAGLEQPEGFGAVESREFGYQQVLTPDQLRALASSWSYVAVSPRRDEILDEVHAVGRSVAGPDGSLVLPHRTWCYRARRLPG